MADEEHVLIKRDAKADYIEGLVIEVAVGGDKFKKQSFFIHKDLLTSRSKFFANALKLHDTPTTDTPTTDTSTTDTSLSSHDKSSDDEHTKHPSSDGTTYKTVGPMTVNAGASVWLQAQSGVVKLPEDAPATFALYIQLLYTGQIPIIESEPGVTPQSVQPQERAIHSTAEEQARIAKLYVLCEKLGDAQSQRMLLKAIVESVEKWHWHTPGVMVTKIIYEGTMEGDPFRQYILDCWVCYASPRWASIMMKTEYPASFFRDVAIGMMQGREKPSDTSKVKDAKNYIDMIQGHSRKRKTPPE